MESDLQKMLEYLKELGLTEISEEEKRVLAKQLSNVKNIDQAKKELELLYALNRMLISSYQKVSLTNMYKINENIDANTILNLFVQYQMIKSKSNDSYTCFENFKKVVEEILINEKSVNEKIKKDANEVMDKTIVLKNALYMTMLDKSKADRIIRNCINRSTHFLANCDAQNLKKLVDCLKRDFSLSEDEIVTISTRCATFFAESSANKVNNLYKTLNEFKDFIANRLSYSKNKSGLQLLERDYKDVLLRSSLIATEDTDTIKETIRFLMGEHVGKIIGDAGDFALLKGDFTPNQLAKIYSKSITCLSTGVDKVVSFTKEISKAYENVFGKELKLDGFINGKNFPSISRLTKADYVADGKVEDIFNLLKEFMSAENVESVLKNHLAFLTCSYQEVKEGLKNAVMQSENSDELRKNILSKIRNCFDTNRGDFVEIEREKGVSVGSLGKIDLKSLKEEEIEDIFYRLGVKENERELWKKNWNKESKEYRELAIECELEDILEQLKDVEEMIPFYMSDLEIFIQENNVVRELLVELDERYNKVFFENKLSKRLLELANVVKENIGKVQNKLDANYSQVTKFYGEQLEALNNELSMKKKASDQYFEDVEEILDIQMKLENNDFNLEGLESLGELISMVNDNVATLKHSLKLSRNKEKMIKENWEGMRAFFNLEWECKLDDMQGILNFSRELGGEQLYVMMRKVFYKEGFIDDMPSDTKLDDVPSYELFKTMVPQTSLRLIEEMKSECEALKDFKETTMNCSLKLLESYKIDTSNIKNVEDVCEALVQFKLTKKEVYSKYKALYDKVCKLEKNIENVDIDKIEDEILELKKQVECYLDKLEEVESKKFNR